MHTVSYEFLMKPKESAGCHQTLALSSRVGAGHETSKGGDHLLQWGAIYSGVNYPGGPPTSGARLLRDRPMANSAVFFGALVGVAAFLISFSLHKLEEGMVTGGASR